MWTWNEFLLALVMVSSDARRTVPLGLAFFQGQHSSDIALLAAAAVLVAFPVVLIYLVFQRRFIEGMLSGAVKEGACRSSIIAVDDTPGCDDPVQALLHGTCRTQTSRGSPRMMHHERRDHAATRARLHPRRPRRAARRRATP
jgi:hypothetical protein